MNAKKAISPVVATALLLVVAVVAVVGFQNWFSNFESNILANTEQKSLTGSNLQIEGIIGDTLYLKSSGADTISLLKISDSSGNEMCEFSGSTNVSNEGLVGWWTFDEIIDRKIKDKSLYQNDLTINDNISLTINSIDFNNIEVILSNAFTGTYNNCELNQNENKYKIINDINNLDYAQLRNFTLNSTISLSTGGADISCNYSLKNINSTNLVNSELKFEPYFNLEARNIPIIFEDKYSFFIKLRHYNLNSNFIERYITISNLTQNSCLRKDKINTNSLRAYNIIPGVIMEDLTLNFLLKNNQNYIFVSVYNETNLALYEKNQLISENNFGDRIGVNFNEINLTISSKGEPFYGYIDEIRIYNRTLSEQEIKQLYYYSIQNTEEGINQIDISSCNLQKGQKYNIVTFTQNSKAESTIIKK